MQKITRFGVSLPLSLLSRFDRLISGKGYANRSEAIRDIMRDHMVEHEWEKGGEVVGIVTIVFEHHASSVKDRVLNLQHESQSIVLSSMHLHLDRHTCLEVIVLRGKVCEVKAFSEKVIATCGVKHGRLVMTTTGKELK